MLVSLINLITLTPLTGLRRVPHLSRKDMKWLVPLGFFHVLNCGGDKSVYYFYYPYSPLPTLTTPAKVNTPNKHNDPNTPNNPNIPNITSNLNGPNPSYNLISHK